MHLSNLKMLCQTVKEDMYLQENTLFDLDLWKYCLVPSTSCDFNLCTLLCPAVYRCIYKKIHYLTSDLHNVYIKVTWNVFQYPLHYVNYAPVKLKLLGSMVKEMYLQEITLFDTKCCSVPSISCDLCTCKVWSCYAKHIRRRCIYKKCDRQTHTHTHRQTDFGKKRV